MKRKIHKVSCTSRRVRCAHSDSGKRYLAWDFVDTPEIQAISLFTRYECFKCMCIDFCRGEKLKIETFDEEEE